MKYYTYILLLLILLSSCNHDYNNNIIEIPDTNIEFNARIKDHGNSTSPLTAIVLTYWDQNHSVEIIIKGKNNNDIRCKNNKLAKSHEIPLLGLYSNHNNTIYVKAYNTENKLVHTKVLNYQTDTLAVNFPEIKIQYLNKEKLGGRFTFVEFINGIYDLPFIFDEYGEIRWYLNFPEEKQVRPVIVRNHPDFYAGDYGDNQYFKYDWLGNEETLSLPEGYKMLHHDVYRHNKSIYFPADNNYILQCDDKGNRIKTWNLVDIVRRYLPDSETLVKEDKDWIHVNAVTYIPEENAILVSARQTLGIFKMDYNSGDIKWILNDTTLQWYKYPKLKNLGLIPQNGCEMPIGQHSPIILPNKNILVKDNGFNGYERNENENLIESKEYSRLVEYKIDETNKTVEQVFEYGRENGTNMFSKFGGSAGYDKNTNSFWALFGYIKSGNDQITTGRLVELDNDGNLLFDVKLRASNAYQYFFRSEKIFFDNYNTILNKSD